MELARAAADLTIRRALGFAGLGIGTVMLALSFDPVLSLRSGAVLVALVWVALLLAALRALSRDLQHTEYGVTLMELRAEVRGNREAFGPLLAVLRRRLLWHADRIALLAAALWAAGFGLALLRG